MAYLDLEEFKALSVMPDEMVDDLETRYPNFLAAQLTNKSNWVDRYLAKRYTVPFSSPYPEEVRGWVAQLVTHKAYLRLGVDPNDAQVINVEKEAESAEQEIREAANAETSLVDIAVDGASAIGRGGPLGYSEQSPYVWADEQKRVAFDEDLNRSGTTS